MPLLTGAPRKISQALAPLDGAIAPHALDDRRSQAMYAVVHGGVDRELRAHSASYLSSLPFDGYAVGGSLGKIATRC